MTKRLGFRHCDPRFGFLWTTPAQPAARWHGHGEGPANYFADTPSGAWAEFLRHEGIVDPEDLAGVRRSLWAVELPGGRRVEVRVPPGVKEGTVLRVPGLRARVQVAPDPVFTREGKDIRVTVPVPLHVALCGGEVAAPTLKGGQVHFKVPPETQNGTKIRLRGLGLPDPKGGTPGDLYAEVRVQLPVPMDEKTRKWAADQPI